MTDDDWTDDDWTDYDSGPHCQHWAQAFDCDAECATCGHACSRHRNGDDGGACHACTCMAFVNQPGQPTQAEPRGSG